jgi:hypothetical protein
VIDPNRENTKNSKKKKKKKKEKKKEKATANKTCPSWRPLHTHCIEFLGERERAYQVGVELGVEARVKSERSRVRAQQGVLASNLQKLR